MYVADAISHVATIIRGMNGTVKMNQNTMLPSETGRIKLAKIIIT